MHCIPGCKGGDNLRDLILAAMAISSLVVENTVLTKVIGEMLEHGNIAKNRPTYWLMKRCD